MLTSDVWNLSKDGLFKALFFKPTLSNLSSYLEAMTDLNGAWEGSYEEQTHNQARYVYK